MSAEEAATLPTAFVTAEAVLNGVVRLQPGETVLIHAGTGGVGLAALQVGALKNFTLPALLVTCLDCLTEFSKRMGQVASQVGAFLLRGKGIEG
jgi:NADPH:quinone reductase-like Zn-dependent oxidoreductase